MNAVTNRAVAAHADRTSAAVRRKQEVVAPAMPRQYGIRLYVVLGGERTAAHHCRWRTTCDNTVNPLRVVDRSKGNGKAELFNVQACSRCVYLQRSFSRACRALRGCHRAFAADNVTPVSGVFASIVYWPS